MTYSLAFIICLLVSSISFQVPVNSAPAFTKEVEITVCRNRTLKITHVGLSTHATSAAAEVFSTYTPSRVARMLTSSQPGDIAVSFDYDSQHHTVLLSNPLTATSEGFDASGNPFGGARFTPAAVPIVVRVPLSLDAITVGFVGSAVDFPNRQGATASTTANELRTVLSRRRFDLPVLTLPKRRTWTREAATAATTTAAVELNGYATPVASVDPGCSNLGATCELKWSRVFCVWQKAALDANNTIGYVFMSSGYLATGGGQADFCTAVHHSIRALSTTDPWRVFMSVLTIVSIFEGSLEAGASHPALQSGEPTTVPVSSVRSNLHCTYGDVVERGVTCPVELVTYLARMTAVRDVQIVLVNDGLHGGTAYSAIGMTFLSAGSTLVNTFVHELGHAQGQLDDEYVASAEVDVSIQNPVNCFRPPAGTTGCTTTNGCPWARWLPSAMPSPAPVGSVESFTTSTVNKGCHYGDLIRPTPDAKVIQPSPPPSGGSASNSDPMGVSNFFDSITKPSSTTSSPSSTGEGAPVCTMRAAHSSFCAMCRQQVTSRLLENPAASKKSDITSPRLPLPAEVLMLSSNAGAPAEMQAASLFVSKYLIDAATTGPYMQGRDGRAQPSTFSISVVWDIEGTLPSTIKSQVLSDCYVNPIPRAKPFVDCMYGSTDSDCDKPEGWVRRSGSGSINTFNDTIRVTAAVLSSAGLTDVTFTATIRDTTKPVPWVVGIGALDSSVARFRVKLGSSTTCGAMGGTSRDWSYALAVNSSYRPPRASVFPSYRYTCSPGQEGDAACYVPMDLKYCSRCDDGEDCTLDLKVFSYSEPKGKGATISSAYVGQGLAFLFILLGSIAFMICVYCLCTRCCIHSFGKHIEKIDGFPKFMYYLAKWIAAFVALSAIGVAVFVWYSYTFTAQAIMRAQILPYALGGTMGIFAAFMLVFTFIVSKRRGLLVINSLVMLLATGVVAWGCYSVYMIGHEISSSSSSAFLDLSLAQMWKYAIDHDPDVICEIQENYMCSGFSRACNALSAANYSYGGCAKECWCTSDTIASGACVPSNSYATPCGTCGTNTSCTSVLAKEISKHNNMIFAVGVAFTVMTFILMIASMIVLFTIRPLPENDRADTRIRAFVGLGRADPASPKYRGRKNLNGKIKDLPPAREPLSSRNVPPPQRPGKRVTAVHDDPDMYKECVADLRFSTFLLALCVSHVNLTGQDADRTFVELDIN